MKVHWRYIHAARNSYSVLYAACAQAGFHLEASDGPAPDVTCYSLNSLNASRFLPEIASADCVTIVGGPHASACWNDLIGIADFVVVGEGEHTLPALLSHIRDGKSGTPPGVATVEGYVPAVQTVLLDAFPPFTRMKGYVEITRGCPHRCGYCQTPSIFGSRMRHRSIDGIIRYASQFRHARFVSPNALSYGSDGLTPRLDKVERLLCRFTNEVYFGTFPSEVRPEWVTDEALALITTHCANTRLQFGAQSGSDRVLRILGRGHTVADVYAAADRCTDFGLEPIVDVILGFPFETPDDEDHTLTLIRDIASRGRVHLHRFTPLPGTPLGNTIARQPSPRAMRIAGSLARSGNLTGAWSDPAIRFCRSRSNDIA